MNLLNKFKAVKRLYKIRKQNKEIESQKKTASFIFDEILKKTPIEEIEKKIFKVSTVSIEISSILKKLKEINYISIPPLSGEPTVSIIIPHYNHYKYLDEALFHLTQQTVLPDEVIVVDDISNNPERIKQIINSYNNKLSIKLIIPEKKLYAGGCRQLGAELATSQIVSMHDADDISHPSRIEITKHFFENNRESLHLNSGFVRFKHDFFSYIRNFSPKEADQKIIDTNKIAIAMKKMFINQQFSVLHKPETRLGCYGQVGDCFWGCHSGHVTYRKELVNMIKWTTPNDYVFTQYEDYDFNFLLFLAGQKSFQIDLPMVYYRIGTSTNTVVYDT